MVWFLKPALPKTMQNKKRANDGEGGACSSSSPPLKRQKIAAAPPSTSVSINEMAARVQQLEQRLQSSEDEIARLQESLQLQKEENNQRLQLQKEENNQRLREVQRSSSVANVRYMYTNFELYGQSWNGKTTDINIIYNLTRLSPLAVHYNANVTNQFIRDIPEMLWWQKILQPFLNLEDLSILRCTNTFFQLYWESVLKKNVIRVPQGCPTLEKAMALAVVFSEKKEYTKVDPLKIQLDKGVHKIVAVGYGLMHVTCSHITFVGKGKAQTTIRGGFWVDNQQNITFEELTITNQSGDGLILRGSETTVNVLKCVVKECEYTGMSVDSGATVTATQCEFMENGDGVSCSGTNTKARLNDCTMHHNVGDGSGLRADDRAVVDLHGTKTDIYCNEGGGIWATVLGKVNIHLLPSQHNTTSHGHDGWDRNEEDGGSIANINADGTFTHDILQEFLDQDFLDLIN
jgi:regulator of replication initiation timing